MLPPPTVKIIDQLYPSCNLRHHNESLRVTPPPRQNSINLLAGPQPLNTDNSQLEGYIRQEKGRYYT